MRDNFCRRSNLTELQPVVLNKKGGSKMAPAILAGIKLGITLGKAIRSLRGQTDARRSAPTHSAMILSPDGNPLYHESVLPTQPTFTPMVYTLNQIVR